MYNMVPTSDTESPADSPRPAPIWQGSGGGRCKRCFKYFSSCTEREETTCVSHPGLWEQAGFGLSFKLACGGWTCCSSRDQDSPGCLILNEHLECLDTTEALKKVGANNSSKGFDLDIAAEPSQKQDRLLDTRPQQAGPKEERPGYLRHMYKPGETLPGSRAGRRAGTRVEHLGAQGVGLRLHPHVRSTSPRSPLQHRGLRGRTAQQARAEAHAALPQQAEAREKCCCASGDPAGTHYYQHTKITGAQRGIGG